MKFWMLQDKCATPHYTHDQKTQGLIAELNHTQHNHNPIWNGHENGKTLAKSHNPLLDNILQYIIHCLVFCEDVLFACTLKDINSWQHLNSGLNSVKVIIVQINCEFLSTSADNYTMVITINSWTCICSSVFELLTSREHQRDPSSFLSVGNAATYRSQGQFRWPVVGILCRTTYILPSQRTPLFTNSRPILSIVISSITLL